MLPGDIERSSMKVNEPVALAEIGNVPLRLVISRQNIHVSRAALHRLGHLIQTAGPADQVARREVIIRVYVHQALKSLPIVMNVGKNQKAGHVSDTIVIALLHARRSITTQYQ